MESFATSDEKENIGSASFSVSARVAIQLGRESISNSIIGILELIKNAYDADAENIIIYFVDLDGTNPTLIIDDDGDGMNEEALLNNWLVIGTNNKLEKRISQGKNRVLTGEKGLGRLGLDRLCEQSTIQTFTSEESYGVELIIDWRKYEATDERLETIKHPVNRLYSKEMYDPVSGRSFTKEHGTRLILSNLKDNWSKEAIEQLYSELSLLVSPFAGINDFTIRIFGRDFFEEIGSNEILEAAEWKLESSITDEGYIIHQMVSRDGQEFNFSEKWSEVFPETKLELPRCGPVELLLYFIPRQLVEGLSFSRSQINTFMDANQGIRIYRDDFRVKPYGDPAGNGDWLNLAFRRQSHPASRGMNGWRIGYNQAVGAVFIERGRNDELLDQTNREGIVEGIAFSHLKMFALHGIEWFERNQARAYRAQNRMRQFEQAQKQAENAQKNTREATKKLEKVVDDTVKILNKSKKTDEPVDVAALEDNLNTAIQEVRDTVEKASEAHQELTRTHEEELQELQEEKDTLHNLASLGILAVAFGHETLRHSNILVGSANELEKELPPLLMANFPPEIRLKVENSIKNIGISARRIRAFGSFMLRNMKKDKRQRVNVYISKIIQDVLKSFDLENTRNVQVELDFPDQTPPIRAFIVDWESIIVNFITNSLWALRTAQDRKIRIRIQEQNNLLHLWFADNGSGISKGTIDHIFEPTFTTKRNERGDKIGTGMGLAIVDNIVQSYGGKIHVISPSDIGGAEFHVEIPILQIASKGK